MRYVSQTELHEDVPNLADASQLVLKMVRASQPPQRLVLHVDRFCKYDKVNIVGVVGQDDQKRLRRRPRWYGCYKDNINGSKDGFLETRECFSKGFGLPTKVETILKKCETEHNGCGMKTNLVEKWTW